ncbi:MAG: hypothetical protein ACREKE_05310 [bacterium]
MPTKTITFSLPLDVGREVLKEAKEEQRTISELVLKWARRSRARRSFKALATQARKLVGQQGLTEKDFGGPFAK